MSEASIPKDIQQQVSAIVEQFNRTTVHAPNVATILDQIAAVLEVNRTTMHAPRDYYAVRFRGRFAYVDHCRGGRVGPVCRLEYGGGMEDWGFAIYKYSSESYDPDEFLFPGSGHLDGTVEGALKAAREAYP